MTLGLLLLVGGVLIVRELIGIWGAFTAATAPILAFYAAPLLARWLTVRRFARQLKNTNGPSPDIR